MAKLIIRPKAIKEKYNSLTKIDDANKYTKKN